MRIELSKATFRRCVQLYLAACVLATALCLWQVLDARLTAFDFEFRELLRRYYGWSDYSDLALGAGAAILLAHLAAMIGLLWFKRWARTLFWSSVLVAVALGTAFGAPVEWYQGWTMALEVVLGGLFGAIVLLSYASGLGENWFNRSAEARQG
ncbi:MAG TPA: hypothetical protein VF603_04570 [Allosphingosinicella sp.]|jgi:hypothetical protein